MWNWKEWTQTLKSIQILDPLGDTQFVGIYEIWWTSIVPYIVCHAIYENLRLFLKICQIFEISAKSGVILDVKTKRLLNHLWVFKMNFWVQYTKAPQVVQFVYVHHILRSEWKVIQCQRSNVEKTLTINSNITTFVITTAKFHYLWSQNEYGFRTKIVSLAPSHVKESVNFVKFSTLQCRRHQWTTKWLHHIIQVIIKIAILYLSYYMKYFIMFYFLISSRGDLLLRSMFEINIIY